METNLGATKMNGRLLVVDDEPNLLKALSARLRAEGYDVSTARSGHEAILELASRTPDLIISDIRMPGMDGYALVRHLRSVQGMELLPVIFLSAKDQAADRIAGFRAGPQNRSVFFYLAADNRIDHDFFRRFGNVAADQLNPVFIG